MPDKKLNAVVVGFQPELAFDRNADLPRIEVGGSLVGLMQGIIIRRLGHNVTILEQHLSSTREGQAAGIVTMEHSHSFMSAHDLLKEQPYAVQCSVCSFKTSISRLSEDSTDQCACPVWNFLYYRLRANFDHLPSSYCKTLPSEPDKDGKAVYDQGKSVKDIRYADGSVIIDFEDLMNNASVGRNSIPADLAIAADGSASRVRQLLQPHLKHTYAGYVACRGTVLDSGISEEIRNTFN